MTQMTLSNPEFVIYTGRGFWTTNLMEVIRPVDYLILQEPTLLQNHDIAIPGCICYQCRLPILEDDRIEWCNINQDTKTTNLRHFTCPTF